MSVIKLLGSQRKLIYYPIGTECASCPSPHCAKQGSLGYSPTLSVSLQEIPHQGSKVSPAWFITGKPTVPCLPLCHLIWGEMERSAHIIVSLAAGTAVQHEWPINTSRGHQVTASLKPHFLIFPGICGRKQQLTLRSESQAIYFYAFKRENHLHPHQRKKRRDQRECKSRQPGSHRERGGTRELGRQAPGSANKKSECFHHRPNHRQSSTPHSLGFRHIQVL